ncbi:MAG: 50S ribosomal protein L2, partial [Candidatus Omnitrophota bacterium]
MGIKQFRPRSPGIRWAELSDFSELTPRHKRPEKKLVESQSKSGGRNSYGRMTSRRRGGGHKRLYRLIDFKRDKRQVEGKVISVEYDPNRSARICLIEYPDKERRYILAPVGLTVGMTVVSGSGLEPKIGSAMPLKEVPLGTQIHNIELYAGRGGQMVRSAGGYAILMAKEGDMAHVRLPSGEVRLIRSVCYATIGQLGNLDHENISLGKAGRHRWMGRRPASRAVAKNPVDHPMGGGEGKSSGGRHPCTPWGVPTKGHKTRTNKSTDKY